MRVLMCVCSAVVCHGCAHSPGQAMGRAFNLEGEAGVRRVISRLERKTWRQQEMAGSDESWLEGLLLSQGQAGAKQERLIPPGMRCVTRL